MGNAGPLFLPPDRAWKETVKNFTDPLAILDPIEYVPVFISLIDNQEIARHGRKSRTNSPIIYDTSLVKE